MARKHFYWDAENVDLPQLDFDNLEQWIADVAEVHGKKLGELSYRFCDDPTILDYNNQYLGHDYFTDIITFDYSKGSKISGDMIISLDTVKTNADLFSSDYSTELHRVIIHGILHLCGINDKGPGEREVMENFENQALDLLRNKFGDFASL